jgi:4-alpha-glucanotransferase
VALYRWLQQACDDQLAAVQLAASSAGMPVGLVHDLPVGVDPGGADAWALRDVLVGEFTVGAPPDLFNQQGQDWQLPPWDPGRLAASGYQPFREVVAATLRHGGGMRADHILGLFRTWWIPPGADPARGTYVSGDPAALLAVLCLEAHRASALVIGEDLGTVLPAVREALRARGVLGSTVALFATGDPRSWRVAAAASVSTHDLPTAAGWLAGEHVRLRARLGQLGRSEAEEEAAWLASRAVVLGRLEAMGYPAQDAVVGLHALLSASPSEVLLVQPGDAVGDLRQPNLPGTTTEYPNWRLPLAGPDGAERSLEELLADPLGARIVALLGAPPPR